MTPKIKAQYRNEVQEALEEMEEEAWEKWVERMDDKEWLQKIDYEQSFDEFMAKFCPECGSYLDEKNLCRVCGYPTYYVCRDLYRDAIDFDEMPY